MAADVIAIIFRTYNSRLSVDHLVSALRKGGVEDLSMFFPPNKRGDKDICNFFRKREMNQVADWWTRRRYLILKQRVVKAVRENQSDEDVSIFVFGSNSFVGRINKRIPFLI